jgi:hypothetical protein
MHGGMIRQSENKELAKSNPQNVAGVGVELAVAEFRNPVIEEAAVSQHSEKDGLKQTAVLRGKLTSVGMTLDEGLGVVVTFRPGMKGGDGGLADVEILRRHEQESTAG